MKSQIADDLRESEADSATSVMLVAASKNKNGLRPTE
jgi:hypothetical protein